MEAAVQVDKDFDVASVDPGRHEVLLLRPEAEKRRPFEALRRLEPSLPLPEPRAEEPVLLVESDLGEPDADQAERSLP